MDHNYDIKCIFRTLEWNLCNKKVLCRSDSLMIRRVDSILRGLLSIEMDSVRREAINLVYELYDATEIYTGVDPRDTNDVNTRERLRDFIAKGD